VIDGPGIVIFRLKALAVPMHTSRRGNSVNRGRRKSRWTRCDFSKKPPPRRLLAGASQDSRTWRTASLHQAECAQCDRYVSTCALNHFASHDCLAYSTSPDSQDKRSNAAQLHAVPPYHRIDRPERGTTVKPPTAPPQSRDCRWQVGRPESPQTGSVRSFPVEAGAWPFVYSAVSSTTSFAA